MHRMGIWRILGSNRECLEDDRVDPLAAMMHTREPLPWVSQGGALRSLWWAICGSVEIDFLDLHELLIRGPREIVEQELRLVLL